MLYWVCSWQRFEGYWCQRKVRTAERRVQEELNLSNAAVSLPLARPGRLKGPPSILGIQWVKVKQSRYRPGVAQRVPGS